MAPLWLMAQINVMATFFLSTHKSENGYIVSICRFETFCIKTAFFLDLSKLVKFKLTFIFVHSAICKLLSFYIIDGYQKNLDSEVSDFLFKSFLIMCLSDEWIGLCAGCVGDSYDPCSPAHAYPGAATHADGHAGEVSTFLNSVLFTVLSWNT